MKGIAFLLILLVPCDLVKCSQDDILHDFNLHQNLDILTTSILSKIDPGVCFAIITDRQYHELLRESLFRSGTEDYPVYLGLISDSEDLLSPNYKTVRMLQEMRRADCGLYVIFLANGIQMERFFRFGDKHRLLSSHAKYVVLHDYRLYTKKMQKIWKKIINVIFVRQLPSPKRDNITTNSSGPWFELTTVPFPPPLKDIFVPKKVDYWQNGRFRRRAALFEDKTNNLDGQILRVAVIEHVPAVTKHPQQRNNSNFGAIFGGVEVQMVKALAMALNFRVEFYESPNPEIEKWGRFQFNGSFSGLLGEIVAARTDFALGDFHYTRYHLTLMDLSIPYDTECLTFLTPEILADNSWKTLMLPFSLEMWIGVCVSLLLVGTIFFILSTFYIYIHHKMAPVKKKRHFRINNLIFWTNTVQKELKNDIPEDVPKKKEKRTPKDIFDDFSNCILYTYSMLLLVSLPRLPKAWAIRLLTGWYYIYCILVVVAYRASMTAILANPVARLTIDTMDQLAMSQLGAGAWGTETKKFFLTSLDETSQAIGERLEEITSADEAVEKVAKGMYAFYENDHFLRKLRSERNHEEDQQVLHIMRDCVIHMPIALGMQKNSPLKPTTDKYVRWIIETGLVRKWLSDTIEEFASSIEPPPEGAIVNLKKMTVAFVALGLGYGLATLALIGEIIYFRCITQKHPLYDKCNLAKYYEMN